LRADHCTGTQISVVTTTTTRVVSLVGELDLASYQECLAALTAGVERHVVLDLAATTFMDCAGYRAIAGFLRHHLRGGERRLSLQGATGEPAYFLALIEKLDGQVAPAPRRSGASRVGST